MVVIRVSSFSFFSVSTSHAASLSLSLLWVYVVKEKARKETNLPGKEIRLVGEVYKNNFPC